MRQDQLQLSPSVFSLCNTYDLLVYFSKTNRVQKITKTDRTDLRFCFHDLDHVYFHRNLHDIIINIATVFGLIAVIGTFIGLLELKWTKLFWVGIFILPLVALNNFLYYKTGLLIYLPVVQKITFLYFLLWICLIDVGLYKHSLDTKDPA